MKNDHYCPRAVQPMKETAPAMTAFLLLLSISGMALGATSRIGNVTPERLSNVDSEPGEWLTQGQNWRQTYHSTLTKINKRNVDQLGFAWAFDLDVGASFEATPVVVDGVMFTSGTFGDVYALDAAKGKLRWSFKPKIEPKRFVFGVHRGVTVWRGKVYVPSADGYLYALDADTGAVVWKVDTFTDRSRAFWITGAAYIAKELVIVGNSGAEWGTRGYVTAYDSQTGKQAWRFFVVPGDPMRPYENPELEWAAKTWDPQSNWNFGGGGNPWDGMAYDPQLNLLYVGTGNGGPWNRRLRSPAGGDNLFLASILAINPDTGRLVWYYQTTPGEDWDYGASQKMILSDLKIGDKVRKVLMQAPKNGFFYVLDRATGELLAAKPIVYTNWASEVDMKTGRPVETGKADYSRGPKLVFPLESGGHNWHPMTYDPGTGLVYIPVQEAGAVFANPLEKFEFQLGRENFGVYYRGGMEWEDGKTPKCWPPLTALRAGEPDPRRRYFLRAWDPIGQKLVWEAKAAGRAGVISTDAGIVFQGDADGRFRAFDSASGSKLADIEVGGSMGASPMTYLVKGEQYIAIMAGPSLKGGYNVKGRIIALKISRAHVPPPTPKSAGLEANAVAEPPVPDTATLADIELGSRLFDANCAMCHTQAARAPDLRQMTLADHKEFFDIVLKGSRAQKGMSNFGGILNESEAKAIHDYVTHLAWVRYKWQGVGDRLESPDNDAANQAFDPRECGRVQP